MMTGVLDLMMAGVLAAREFLTITRGLSRLQRNVVGAGGGSAPRTKAVRCKGLINKAIQEAQQMIDGFKGLGVWGDLRCRAPEDGAAVLQFGYSGWEDTDDADD